LADEDNAVHEYPPSEGAGAVPSKATRMFRVTINGTVEDVWREITRTDRVLPCFFHMRMHVSAFRPGGALRMRSADGRYTGVVGDIIEWDPPRRFSHTFRFTNFDDPPCIVIYELSGRDGAVEFTLTIEEIPLGTKSAKQMIQGGDLIVRTLKAAIEGTPIPFLMRFIGFMGRVTAPLTPKRCRSERWP
jgi:uncharacterized protein YndB with AHSA1/START domain